MLHPPSSQACAVVHRSCCSHTATGQTLSHPGGSGSAHNGSTPGTASPWWCAPFAAQSTPGFHQRPATASLPCGGSDMDDVPSNPGSATTDTRRVRSEKRRVGTYRCDGCCYC